MSATAKRGDIPNPGLADAGQARIEWVDAQMPVLAQVREALSRERPLEGMRIAACLHVTTETANLVRSLIAGGADVALCASNPLSTQDDVAAALAEHHGAEVHAIHGEQLETYYRHIEKVAKGAPHVTMDDGADVTSVIHARHPELLAGIVGGTEQTSSGVIRLRALEGEGRLAYPIVSVSEARTKQLFDNRYGTGQSTLDGILRATNVLLAGRVVVVLGYGWCGKGVAVRARGAGAEVVVCEVDALRALEARMDGFEVSPALSAARRGDVFITVTGSRDVLSAPHFELMKDGAIVANAGHFDVEIDVAALRSASRRQRQPRPSVTQYELVDGRRINLLADGRVVNLAAAEGHPAAVMDASFAIQALAVRHLVRHAGGLAHRVHPVPAEIDSEVATLALQAMNVEIDVPSAAQEAYGRSWEHGT